MRGVSKRKRSKRRWEYLAVAILTIIWVTISLHINSLSDIGYLTSSYENYIHFNLGNFSTTTTTNNDDIDIIPSSVLNETIHQLKLATPRQERHTITIGASPSHMNGYQFEHCEVTCIHTSNDASEYDGSFASSDPKRGIIHTMESITNYPSYSYAASKLTHRIVMNTQQISDIPMNYNNWEYNYLRPVQYDYYNKPERSLASAFISNCGAQSFRLRAIDALRSYNVSIEQYGICDRTKDGGGDDKVNTIARHLFYLAFENSEEEDYVTEKFFQAYEAGTIPITIGAPNIEHFAPMTETYLHIRTIDDIPSIATRMHEIANNVTLYQHYLRYKTEGLSDTFLAITDTTIPHTFCQACYIFADDKNSIQQRALQNITACHRDIIPKRGSLSSSSSLSTNSNKNITLHRFYVRERTQFVYRDLFIKTSSTDFGDVTYTSFLINLKKVFHDYRPTWTHYRDAKGLAFKYGGNETATDENFLLRIHRICDKYANAKTCLYSTDSPLVIRDDTSLQRWLVENPCGELAIVFV